MLKNGNILSHFISILVGRQTLTYIVIITTSSNNTFYIVHQKIPMASQFVGHHVSVTCIGGLGHYQGCIENVNTDGQKITLRQPYKNGLKVDLPQITLW